MEQANKMRAKATKAAAAQQMIKRAEKLCAAWRRSVEVDKVAAIRFPDPAPGSKTRFRRRVCRSLYGSLENFHGR